MGGMRRHCAQKRSINDRFHMAIVVLFVAVMIVLVIQNREVVSMAFLGLSIRAPLALITAVVYFLGAIAGGSLFAMLRRSIEGARPTPP